MEFRLREIAPLSMVTKEGLQRILVSFEAPGGDAPFSGGAAGVQAEVFGAARLLPAKRIRKISRSDSNLTE